MKAVLVLENGIVFQGQHFGAAVEGLGEVSFNTSMSGYQEILTDPSYCKQIVAMTYPMIGNYGINELFDQSDRIQCAGFVVKQYVRRPSSYLSKKSLGDYLVEQGVPGIEQVDTRKLVMIIRDEGAMRGGIFMGVYNDEMLAKVRSIPVMAGLDLTDVVTTKKPYTFGNIQNKRYQVAVLDFGVKRAILKRLDEIGFGVHVFPAKTSIDEIKDFDCFVLSNGPGDPEVLHTPIQTTKALLESGKPIFGICLGHQLLGLAYQRETQKLKYGHHGSNQGVRDSRTGNVEFTAQNHGFVVHTDNAVDQLDTVFTNLNDQTIEGFVDKSIPVMSSQHHPEASPGPHDSAHLFLDFYRMVEKFYS